MANVLRLHLITLTGLALATASTTPIYGQSITPASDGTGTIVTPNGQEFTITGGTQSGANLFHSFQQFGLDANQIATFLATPDLQNILGRVVGGNPSVINGLLQVTGGSPNLYLMNPAGIIFGNNASLNVPASFTATTAPGIGFGDGGVGGWFNAYGPHNYGTLIGNPTSFRFDLLLAGGAGSIVNAGTLAVTPGHSLNLIGNTVINTGTLAAPGGSVTVMAVPNSSLVRLSQPGSLLSLEVLPPEFSGSPSPTSVPPSVSLPELLTGSGFSAQATGLAVEADGTVRLTATNTPIPQTAGTTIVSGTIDVSPSGFPTPETPSPQVNILGDRVGLFSATIQASGSHDGGTILVGGDYQGKGSVPNALYTYVDANSVLQANAGQTGQGGKVIIWADDTTRFAGTITARGGIGAGDGGFVEVSGKNNLAFAGQVDTQATQGQAGTLLLDPTDINIVNGTFPAGNAVDGLWATTEDVGTQSIGTTDIGTILLTTDLILEASNNINWGTGVTLNYDGIPNGRTLTLRANNTISFSGAIQDGTLATPDQLNVTFNADRDGSGAGAIVLNGGTISTNGGTILLGGGTDPTTGFAASDVTNSRGILLANGTTLNSNGGNIILRGTSTLAGIPTSGIEIVDLNTQLSSGTGAITLVGSNPNPSSRAPAIFVGPGSQVLSTTGPISLGGTSAGYRGIDVQGNIQSSNGNVTLAGNTIDSVSEVALIISGRIQGNTVGLVGTSAGQGVFARGVEIADGAQVTLNAGGGQITVEGRTASTNAGPNGNTAILMLGTLDAAGGDVQFLAQANAGIRGVSMTSLTPQINNARSISATSNQDIVITALNLTTLGGPLTLTSTLGNVITSNLVTNGGALAIKAATAITTGTINTTSVTNGGNVTLDPTGDIQVTSINAQGGTRGVGGTVDITTDRFFRATGSFTDNNGVLASISSAGGTEGGPITIRHGGGTSTPFVVGQSGSNGTVAAITASSSALANTIASGSFPQTYIQGNISLITAGVGIAAIPTGLSTNEDSSPNQYAPSTQVVIPSDAGPTFPIFESAPQALQRIEESTGKKPAVIYVSFFPTTGVSAIDNSLPAVDDRFSADYRSLLERQPTTPQLSTPKAAPSLLKFLPAERYSHQPGRLTDRSAWQSQANPMAASLQPSPSDGLELVLITTTGKPIRIRVPATRAQVEQVANSLRASVSNSDSTDYLEPAQQLYQWLVAPLEAELKRQNIDTLVFSMDEGLRTLPVAALYDGQRYLVETYSVALTPSFNLTDTRYQSIKRLQVLGMGASTFQTLTALPAVPVELQMVQTFWPGQTFLNQDFTLANLKAARTTIPYGIIHLATHADFRSYNAFIQLWDTQLQLTQVDQLGWNDPPVELLVLSACRTAVGDRDTELGFAGLAVRAGVKSVLASLWSVSDDGTMALMSEFYRQLNRPEVTIKAEALRQAQLAMISGKARPDHGVLRSDRGVVELPPDLAQRMEVTNLSHPYYWSAFTIIGSPW